MVASSFCHDRKSAFIDSYRFLVFLCFQLLSLNQRVCSVKPQMQIHHCSQFVIVLNLRVVRVQGQQPEPRLQTANIAQYFYVRNALLSFLVIAHLTKYQFWVLNRVREPEIMGKENFFGLRQNLLVENGLQ